MKICFASHNKNKVAEIARLLPQSIEVVGLDDLSFTEEIEETGTTLEENSRIKAKVIHERFQIPVFADDSGLLVSALNGEPGVFSARYAGPQKDDKQNMDLLLKNLAETQDRSASFQTVITYIDQEGSEKQFKGIIEGEITSEKRGNQGFGYDPIFQPKGFQKTFAELGADEKNRISHRGKAVKQLIDYLHQQHG